MLATGLAKVAGNKLLDGLTVAPGYERALAAALADDLDAPLGSQGAQLDADGDRFRTTRHCPKTPSCSPLSWEETCRLGGWRGCWC